jgi:hypothetical protein
MKGMKGCASARGMKRDYLFCQWSIDKGCPCERAIKGVLTVQTVLVLSRLERFPRRCSGDGTSRRRRYGLSFGGPSLCTSLGRLCQEAPKRVVQNAERARLHPCIMDTIQRILYMQKGRTLTLQSTLGRAPLLLGGGETMEPHDVANVFIYKADFVLV